MANKNEKPEVYENKNGEGNRRVFVYQNGERYFGRLCRISDNKVILEWDFDAYVCLDNYFLYQTGDNWFCFKLEPEARTVYLGRRLAETFYVRENEAGTVHYAYFDYDGDYCLLESNALRVEESYFGCSKEKFILVFEKTNFCKAFYLAPGGSWIDPVHFFSFMRDCGGYLSVKAGEENTPYGLFYDEREDGYRLLHKGKNLSRFYNAFVSEEGDKFVLYVYDGKELVAAEEGRRFFQNDEELALEDKFWARRDDFPDLLNPNVMEVPETIAEKQAGDKSEDVVAVVEEPKSSPKVEIPKETGFSRRLWRWLGFGK